MKLEIYFDYTCPFCHHGYEVLKEALPHYPDLELVWVPCEAHPRPEQHGIHSDLTVRGMYLVQEQGGDLMRYHDIMYKAGVFDKCNIENPEVVADLVKDLVDREVFLKDLKAGKYQEQLEANNRTAWEVERFPAVPSLKLGADKLDAVPGVGISRVMVMQFLSEI